MSNWHRGEMWGSREHPRSSHDPRRHGAPHSGIDKLLLLLCTWRLCVSCPAEVVFTESVLPIYRQSSRLLLWVWILRQRFRFDLARLRSSCDGRGSSSLTWALSLLLLRLRSRFTASRFWSPGGWHRGVPCSRTRLKWQDDFNFSTIQMRPRSTFSGNRRVFTLMLFAASLLVLLPVMRPTFQTSRFCHCGSVLSQHLVLVLGFFFNNLCSCPRAALGQVGCDLRASLYPFQSCSGSHHSQWWISPYLHRPLQECLLPIWQNLENFRVCAWTPFFTR